jgi:hypothetical protein
MALIKTEIFDLLIMAVVVAKELEAVEVEIIVAWPIP